MVIQQHIYVYSISADIITYLVIGDHTVSCAMMANISLQTVSGQFCRLNTAGKIRLAVAGACASYVGARLVYYVYKRVTNRQRRLGKQKENADSIEQLSRRLKENPLSVSPPCHVYIVNCKYRLLR